MDFAQTLKVWIQRNTTGPLCAGTPCFLLPAEEFTKHDADLLQALVFRLWHGHGTVNSEQVRGNQHPEEVEVPAFDEDGCHEGNEHVPNPVRIRGGSDSLGAVAERKHLRTVDPRHATPAVGKVQDEATNSQSGCPLRPRATYKLVLLREANVADGGENAGANAHAHSRPFHQRGSAKSIHQKDGRNRGEDVHCAGNCYEESPGMRAVEEPLEDQGPIVHESVHARQLAEQLNHQADSQELGIVS